MQIPHTYEWTRLVEILSRLPERLRSWFHSPIEYSLPDLEQPDLDDEQNACRDANRIVHDQARVAIIVMADNLESIYRLLSKEPLMVFSTWVLARAVQEGASTVLWLLNPKITTKERWARSLNIRIEGLKAQRRIPNSKSLLIDTPRIEKRIANLSVLADHLGLSRKGERRNPKHFGSTGHPRVLDRIKKTLQEEVDYRILSAMAHGENWALIGVSFARDARGRYGPDLSFTSAAYLISKPTEWFARVHWEYGCHYGLDLEVLSTVLEEEYERAGLSEAIRFWREYR